MVVGPKVGAQSLPSYPLTLCSSQSRGWGMQDADSLSSVELEKGRCLKWEMDSLTDTLLVYPW